MAKGRKTGGRIAKVIWSQRRDGRWLVRCRTAKDNYLWSRVVLWNEIGRELATDEVVHHISGDKTDDRLENLRLLSHSDHARMHLLERPDRAKSLPLAVAASAAKRRAKTHCKH